MRLRIQSPTDSAAARVSVVMLLPSAVKMTLPRDLAPKFVVLRTHASANALHLVHSTHRISRARASTQNRDLRESSNDFISTARVMNLLVCSVVRSHNLSHSRNVVTICLSIAMRHYAHLIIAIMMLIGGE